MTAAASLWPDVRAFVWDGDWASWRSRTLDSDETVKRPQMGDEEPDASVELLRRAHAGDDRALELLLTRYLPRLRRWAHGRLPRWARGPLETDDLVQETVLAALRNFGNFTPRHDGAVGAYLRQALVHRIQDEIKKARRKPAVDELPETIYEPGPSPFEQAVGGETLMRFEAALARLHDEEREAVVLRVELRYSYAEIAAAMGKPSADAARMTVGRALIRLAQEMGHVQ